MKRALSAACFAGISRRVLATTAAVVAFSLLGASFYGERVISIHVSANKRARRIESIYSAWNTLSLVQVVEDPPDGKDPSARTVVVDSGTAATGISDLRPDVRRTLAERPEQIEQESMIAYVGKANPKILIIGSGAGDQVLAD